MWSQLNNSSRRHPGTMHTRTLLQLSTREIKNPQKASEINNKIFQELDVVYCLVIRVDKIIPPDAPEETGGINIRTKLLDIAHEGHPGENSMKHFVRSRLWFPKMDTEITVITRGCLACQAATETKSRDPLIPSIAPEELWKTWPQTTGGLLQMATSYW